jgi:hypothetical protein
MFAPRSPRPRPRGPRLSAAPRPRLAELRRYAPSPASEVDAVERADRFGHHFDRLPGISFPAVGAIQRQLKVGYSPSGRKKVDLKGRPKGFAKGVDKTLSKEESEKPYYEGGKLREGYVRGHIVEWQTKRRALEARYNRLSKPELAKHLGLSSGARDDQIQHALFEQVKDEYSNPKNIAINDESDFDAGGEANDLAQKAERDRSVLRKLYSAAFNPGLSGKGFTPEKVEEYHADFQDAWGVDPAKEGWEEDLRQKYGARAVSEEKRTESKEEESEDEGPARGIVSKRKRSSSSSSEQAEVDSGEEREEEISPSLPASRPVALETPPPKKKKKKNKRKKRKLREQETTPELDEPLQNLSEQVSPIPFPSPRAPQVAPSGSGAGKKKKRRKRKRKPTPLQAQQFS